MKPAVFDVECPPADSENMQALDRAEASCRARGASLTAIRREVLDLLYRSPTGVKAYNLLAQIKEARPSASPPTVYRALDFLIEQDLAHKIGRMNLFVACRHASHQIPSLFLVCPKCSGVTEIAGAIGAERTINQSSSGWTSSGEPGGGNQRAMPKMYRRTIVATFNSGFDRTQQATSVRLQSLRMAA